MATRTRIAQAVPYMMVLAGAAVLYRVADNFQHTPTPGQIGPDFWPKLLLGLMAACCVYEILRTLYFGSAAQAQAGPAEDFESEVASLEVVEDHPWLVVLAIVASIAYLISLDWIGFFVASLLYVFILEWLGGVRRIVTLVTTTVGITVFFTFMFSTVIYVALPHGRGVFQTISLAVLKLLWAQ